MKIKICGVRSVRDAELVREAGAELAGLNFVPRSRRYLRASEAPAVRRALGAVEAVGVFMDEELDVMLAAADALELRWVQLHGREPLATVRRVSRRCAVIRAVIASELADTDMTALAPWVSAFLLDGASPGSGTPVLHPTDLRASLCGRPFFVAGGLRPDNVADAVRRTHPDGVDVATGVTAGGSIDAVLLGSFVERARAALVEVA